MQEETGSYRTQEYSHRYATIQAASPTGTETSMAQSFLRILTSNSTTPCRPASNRPSSPNWPINSSFLRHSARNHSSNSRFSSGEISSAICFGRAEVRTVPIGTLSSGICRKWKCTVRGGMPNPNTDWIEK